MALSNGIRSTVVGRAVAALMAAGLLVQCAAPTTVTGPDTSSAMTTPAPTSRTTSATTTAPPPGPAPATVHTVTAADLGSTWRPGCPVQAEQLRRVQLTYLGFDGRPRRGALVVAADLVPAVIDVFDELYREGFPIERMRTVDRYPGASDELSMRDDNTSAFNCRPLPSGTRWSPHAYGRAIDVNPLLNPYVDSRGGIQPGTAGPYLDRTRTDRGLIRADDPVVRAFTSRGWRWGGNWRTPKDYQHFEKP